MVESAFASQKMWFFEFACNTKMKGQYRLKASKSIVVGGMSCTIGWMGLYISVPAWQMFTVLSLNIREGCNK